MNRIEINKYIIADPKICHGKPCFKGTRIMVWQILNMLANRETTKEILEAFPSLTPKHIQAALDYASQVIQKEIFIIPHRNHETLAR